MTESKSAGSRRGDNDARGVIGWRCTEAADRQGCVVHEQHGRRQRDGGPPGSRTRGFPPRAEQVLPSCAITLAYSRSTTTECTGWSVMPASPVIAIKPRPSRVLPTQQGHPQPTQARSHRRRVSDASWPAKLVPRSDLHARFVARRRPPTPQVTWPPDVTASLGPTIFTARPPARSFHPVDPLWTFPGRIRRRAFRPAKCPSLGHPYQLPCFPHSFPRGDPELVPMHSLGLWVVRFLCLKIWLLQP